MTASFSRLGRLLCVLVCLTPLHPSYLLGVCSGTSVCSSAVIALLPLQTFIYTSSLVPPLSSATRCLGLQPMTSSVLGLSGSLHLGVTVHSGFRLAWRHTGSSAPHSHALATEADGA